MDRRNIIVIGGSAGATNVLRRVCAELPQDFPASVFVVTHFQARGPHVLREVLAQTSKLPVCIAIDGQPIEPGRIYLPEADRHLLLGRDVIRLGRGPRENMTRPAIDPLFRSAALAYGPRVVGLVLSGYLDDGASGLAAIKSRGGVALVQHPLDAEVSSMPEAALATVDADATLRTSEMAEALIRYAASHAPPHPAPPDATLELEVLIAGGAAPGAAALSRVATPTAITCPTCHGVLSELNERPLRYRCQTGHAFTPEAALQAQQTDVDEALVIALRVMEERVNLVTRMGREAREQGRNAIAELYEGRAEEYGRYTATLRRAAIQTLTPETVVSG
jgi:two-component system chemotaxis response regulator CheB